MDSTNFIKLSKKKTIWIAIGAIVYMAITFSNALVAPALDFLTDVSNEMVEALGFSLELKSLTYSLESANIPFTTGTTEGLSETFDKAINYLTFTNVVVVVQMILVNMGKSLFFKLVPILLLVGYFIKKYSQMAVRLLIIALLINPGLSLYVNGMEYVAASMEMDLGTSLHAHLGKIREKYDKKKEEYEAKLENKEQGQLEKDKEKGRDQLSLSQKVEDKVEEVSMDAKIDIQEGVAMLTEALKEGRKELTKLIINLISSVIVLFMLLPLLYFYMINFILKKFFHFSMLKELKSIEDENFDELENVLQKK